SPLVFATVANPSELMLVLTIIHKKMKWLNKNTRIHVIYCGYDVWEEYDKSAHEQHHRVEEMNRQIEYTVRHLLWPHAQIHLCFATNFLVAHPEMYACFLQQGTSLKTRHQLIHAMMMTTTHQSSVQSSVRLI